MNANKWRTVDVVFGTDYFRGEEMEEKKSLPKGYKSIFFNQSFSAHSCVLVIDSHIDARSQFQIKKNWRNMAENGGVGGSTQYKQICKQKV